MNRHIQGLLLAEVGVLAEPVATSIFCKGADLKSRAA